MRRARTGGLLTVADLRADKRGSLEDQMIELARQLGSRGVRSDFRFSGEADPAVRDRLEAAGASVGALTFRDGVRGARALYRLLRAERYPLVHFHFVRGHDPLVLAARAAGARVLLTEHLVLSAPSGRLRAQLARARGFLGKAAERRVAVSSAVARSLIAVEQVPPSRIEVVRNAIDVDRFRRSPAAAAELRRELDIEGPMILCVARFAPEKGVDVLVRAIAGARPGSRLARATVVLIGGERGRAELEALGRELGVAGRLLFVGQRDDTERFYSCATVTVVPSRCAESCSLVTLEAQAASCPLVATRVGGIPEHLEHGQGGLLVPPDDPVAMAAGLDAILENERCAAELGARGRSFVEAHFGLERWSAELLRVLCKLGLPLPARPLAGEAAALQPYAFSMRS